MKLSEKFIRLGLILLIALSLYFSYVIWLSPSNRTVHEQTMNQVIATQNYRKASDVFMPLSVSWIDGEDIQQTTSETLISELQPLITSAKIEKLATTTYDSFDEFQEQADIQRGIELDYVGPFSLQEYLTMFDLNSSEKSADGYFTKVQLDFEQKEIRFINVKRYQITKAAMAFDQTDFQEVLEQAKTTWTAMTKENRLQNLQFNLKEPVKMKMYSYISSSQAYTVFRDAFFKDAADVKSNEDSQDVVLYDGSENMTIQQEQQLVDFRGELLPDEDSTDIYSQSFHFISRLGTNLGNVRFFDRSKDTANYRIFVEGFPVFSEDIRGEINLTISEDKSGDGLPVHIQTSLNTIQVPIPSEEEIELANNETIIDQILAAGGNREQIRSMIIGYQWQDIKDTNGVVDLVPTWYIKYDETWYPYKKLVTQLSETEAE
ncbi:MULTISPECIES: YycH family regulatory protein [Enterococcus]|uniref:YycH family regulatory protein n=1 Tax=Enterococcus TaxID=1350 RepID=UPI00065E341C|nr:MULTISPECIES: two-component system activity regulator YycH [Enterococcus]